MNAIFTPDVSSVLKDATSSKKKKVLVLYSEGGGGHKAAAEAIKHLLSSDYQVEIVNVLTEVFRTIDFFLLFSKGRYTAEDFYNTMMKRGFHGMINLYALLGKGYMQLLDKKLKKLFSHYIDSLKSSPDMIISVLPFFNGAMAPISLEKNIPFVLMPTDLDVTTFVIGLPKEELISNPKFAFAFPYDDPDLKGKALSSLPLEDTQVAITGFPVRPSCLKCYTDQEIDKAKQLFKLRSDSKVVTLVLGASGGENIVSYSIAIANSELYKLSFIELNICVGRNEVAAQRVLSKLLMLGAICTLNEKSHTILYMPTGMVIHIRGFINNFPELMACSDLIISKTGSASVNEAIYLKKQLLLDDTRSSSSRKLKWESVNVPFVKKYNLGDAFRNKNELIVKIGSLLSKRKRAAIYQNYLEIPDFESNLKNLVLKMVERD